jgi:hypothetical protein
LKVIIQEDIEQKAKYFFGLSNEKTVNLLELLFNLQPEVTAFVYSFRAEQEIAESKKEEPSFTPVEVDFGTDMLTFILYIMLPQDKIIPGIPSDKIVVYQDKVMDIMEKISDDNQLPENEKDAVFNDLPQTELRDFVFNEMLSARNDSEITEDFKNFFMYQALTLICCLDGEIK